MKRHSRKWWSQVVGLVVGTGLVIAGAVTGKIPIDQVIQYFLSQSDTIHDVIENNDSDTGDSTKPDTNYTSHVIHL